MKKIIFSISLAVLLSFTLALYAHPFNRGKTLSYKETKQKWGEIPVDYAKFKKGDLKTRSQMAASLLKDTSLLGKSVSYIRENLGGPDGFYFIDTYPAYIIQDGQSQTEETWQIVFRINGQSSVRDIVIHKNCCE
jgi:hypothetical protein